MTVEIKLLQAAIEHTAYLINREIKQLPADFVPFWEMISEGPAIVEGIQAREEFLYDLVRGAAEELGGNLGRFDIPGQLRGLENTRKECCDKLQMLTQNNDSRLRSYQTLGLCAGAALAILLV